ncbi:MAG: hypothetical protein AABZ33_05920 [Chloroflexota bacterium]
MSATVDPVAGGRLASLVVGGRERLIDVPNLRAELPAISWGSFAMIPWVGRIRHGQLTWAGTTFALPRNLGEHAIHGAAFDQTWAVTAVDERSVELRLSLAATARWPFAAELVQVIALTPDAIAFRAEVRAERAMPVAIGWHPWFRRHGDEPIEVTVPAEFVLETTDDIIPTGVLLPVDGPTDLRRAVDVMDRRLDHAFVAVTGPCRVAWPDLELSIDAEPVGSVVVHTTPTAVCVEPQTAWPDAVRLAAAGAATGLVALEAGDTFVATSRWTWRRAGVDGPAGEGERAGDEERT